MADTVYMEFAAAKIRGVGFILWQARHMAYHVMLALLWVWFLRELWGVLNVWWIIVAAVGSVLPDVDHLRYFLTYGRKDAYSKQVFSYIKKGEWRRLFQFVSTGHKHNTSLEFHNVYVMGLFMVSAMAAASVDWQMGVVLFGAISSHYIFDMADDVVLLGQLNRNWTRWGRPMK